MLKLVVFVALAVCLVSASPKPGILAAAPLAIAPAVAPAVVTATSSQAFVRNYNTLAAPLVAAPALAAPLVAAPSPYVAPGLAPLVGGPLLL